jgi:hypothetical protein
MSEVKVNKISPRTNCGTVQLGDSGDTITIPAGATITNSGTATGFGATGAVNWETGSIKTAGFTATAGEGYFLDTSSGGFTVNLPAGTAGAVVGFKDYANSWNTGNVVLDLNGSDKIGGQTTNPTLSTQGLAVTLVFVDATKGWLVTDSGLQNEAPGALFVTASGGCESTSGNFKIHRFNGPGTFTVTCAGNPAGSTTVDYLVVAGGGGGGANAGGGGGAGGTRFSSGAASGCFAIPVGSPLGAPALLVPAQSYTVTVGGGGAGQPGPGPNNAGCAGNNSSFSSIASAGGGGGGGQGQIPGNAGGSGGGARSNENIPSGGAGNTPPVSPPQGNPGGGTPNAPAGNGGGGGGATAAGATGTPTPASGVGGAGITTCITGSPLSFGGGGGGGRNPPSGPGAAGGTGGGGSGQTNANPGTAGGCNTGGGGGGGGGAITGGGAQGGSGVVIIRYKFQ